MSLLLCLCRGWGAIKGDHAWASGLSSGFLAAVHFITLHEELWTLSSSYLSASLGVRLQLYREVFFICLVVSAQAYLEHLELVYFRCMQARQVAHLPGSTQTWYWSSKDGNLLVWIGTHGINHNSDENTDSLGISEWGHIFWCPWVGWKRSGRIPEVWFDSVELWQFLTIP